MSNLQKSFDEYVKHINKNFTVRPAAKSAPPNPPPQKQPPQKPSKDNPLIHTLYVLKHKELALESIFKMLKTINTMSLTQPEKTEENIHILLDHIRDFEARIRKVEKENNYEHQNNNKQ